VINLCFKGYIIDRIKAEIKENEDRNNSSATFFGERGQKHMFGSMMDLFLAGILLRHLILETQ